MNREFFAVIGSTEGEAQPPVTARKPPKAQPGWFSNFYAAVGLYSLELGRLAIYRSIAR
jgi:hypothetical protein